MKNRTLVVGVLFFCKLYGYQGELKVKINRDRIHTIINKATKQNKEVLRCEGANKEVCSFFVFLKQKGGS